MRTSIKLVARTATQDSIGQQVFTETSRTVLAECRSVSMSEWTNAQQVGLSAEYQMRFMASDWNGERLVEYDNRRFSVYRTFRDGHYIELYLSEMIGHA